MSELSNFIADLETKAKHLEQNSSQALANYHSLLGYLGAINEVIADAKKIALPIAEILPIIAEV